VPRPGAPTGHTGKPCVGGLRKPGAVIDQAFVCNRQGGHIERMLPLPPLMGRAVLRRVAGSAAATRHTCQRCSAANFSVASALVVRSWRERQRRRSRALPAAPPAGAATRACAARLASPRAGAPQQPSSAVQAHPLHVLVWLLW